MALLSRHRLEKFPNGCVMKWRKLRCGTSFARPGRRVPLIHTYLSRSCANNRLNGVRFSLACDPRSLRWLTSWLVAEERRLFLRVVDLPCLPQFMENLWSSGWLAFDAGPLSHSSCCTISPG